MQSAPNPREVNNFKFINSLSLDGDMKKAARRYAFG